MTDENKPRDNQTDVTPDTQSDDPTTDLSNLSSEELQAHIDAVLSDGASSAEPSATKSAPAPNSEFEQHMADLWEKKRAEQAALDASRQAYEAELLQRQARHREELEQRRIKAEAQLKASLAQTRAEKEAKAAEMMETLREERERKQREREAADAKLREERAAREDEWKRNHRLTGNASLTSDDTDT